VIFRLATVAIKGAIGADDRCNVFPEIACLTALLAATAGVTVLKRISTPVHWKILPDRKDKLLLN
jgi:hypothetical protein